MVSPELNGRTFHFNVSPFLAICEVERFRYVAWLAGLVVAEKSSATITEALSGGCRLPWTRRCLN